MAQYPEQLHIMEQTDFKIDIKSPIFTPRPGWGGKLKNWLRKNGQSKLLPILSVALLVLGLFAYWNGKDRQTTSDDISAKTIYKVAEPRQGLPPLARAAINDYLTSNNIELSQEQKLYAETYLVDLVGKRSVSVGETISFEASQLSEVVEKAKALTPYQIQEWSKYLK